jgi:uncharacterized repeat protein (TIGR03803 family)
MMTATPTLTTLVSFNYGGPIAGLIADAAGDLFGTTAAGGPNRANLGYGTVFELVKDSTAPTGYTLNTLATFNGANGATPYAGLIADAAGDLFGTTSGVGANGDGTVFEITNSGFVVDKPTALPDRANAQVGGPRRELIQHEQHRYLSVVGHDGLQGRSHDQPQPDAIGFHVLPRQDHIDRDRLMPQATATGNVLANDTDPLYKPNLTVTAVNGQANEVGQPITDAYGTLTLNADGSYSYQASSTAILPTSGVVQDVFTYTEDNGHALTRSSPPMAPLR